MLLKEYTEKMTNSTIEFGKKLIGQVLRLPKREK